ncbi:MAG: hypothetical protein IID45_10815, partial [Planctomycetes bacterium]|nr:hypothetical protein [Planctomycetota bacterium]
MALPDDQSPNSDAVAEPDDENSSSPDAAAASGWLDRIRKRMPKRLNELLANRKRNAVILVAALISAVILWLVVRPEQDSQDVQLQLALSLLQDRKNPEHLQRARKIAVRLRKARYRDPNFAGGVEYVLGITSFRAAQEQYAENRDKSFLSAVRFLREAEKYALDVRYRPEWAYSLGVSLDSLGSSEAALPLLKEAMQTYPPGRIESSIRLAGLYRDRKDPAELKQAIKLTETVLKSPSLTLQQKDRVYLLKAQLHLALAQHRQAKSALAHVSDTGSGNQGARVFRAQTLMANAEMLASRKEIATLSSALGLILRNKSEQKFLAALQELKPVSEIVRLDQTFRRRALLLMGICAQRIAELDEGTVSASKFDAAISYFSRAAQNYAHSHEGIAANLRLADLLRAAERGEEALKAYSRALKSVTNPAIFRNRWISLKEFRSRILAAWNGWVEEHAYLSAIELAKLMSPLIDRIQAKELEALAHQRWAEHLKRRLFSAKFSERKLLRKKMLTRWKISGQTHGELAKLLLTSSRYPNVLWVSAEHLRQGHEFKRALSQFTRFIDFRPKRKLPLAIVRRGQVFMDLDRFDDALKQFTRVTNSYPTDPAAFEAQ